MLDWTCLVLPISKFNVWALWVKEHVLSNMNPPPKWIKCMTQLSRGRFATCNIYFRLLLKRIHCYLSWFLCEESGKALFVREISKEKSWSIHWILSLLYCRGFSFCALSSGPLEFFFFILA